LPSLPTARSVSLMVWRSWRMSSAAAQCSSGAWPHGRMAAWSWQGGDVVAQRQAAVHLAESEATSQHQVAEAFGVNENTVLRWRSRYAAKQGARPLGDHSAELDLQSSRLEPSNGCALSNNALRVVSHASVAGWVVEHPGTHGGFSGAYFGNVQDSRLGQPTSEASFPVPWRGFSVLCRSCVRCDALCGLYLGRDQQLRARHSRRY